MVRITKVHTGGGDSGETSLVDGSRVAKSNARIEIVGTCDEVNALLGMVLMESNRISDTHADGGERITVRRVKSVCASAIGRLQSELFDLGAELACPPDKIPEFMELIDQEDSDRLCEEMDTWNEELSPLESFILPTGTGAISALHLARTVTRRFERSMVGIVDEIRPVVLQYVNRLSDWLFVLTRWITLRLGEDETLWVPKGKRDASASEMTRRQKANQ